MSERKHYTIEWSRTAIKGLRRLPKEIQIRLLAASEALASEPRPHGCEKMEGSEQEYRIREGDYRLVYEIQDKQLFILVIKVGHRKEIYR